MRLIIDAKASADPVVGVRWCFGRDEMDRIITRDKDRMKILLISLYSDGTEDRVLVPASEIMTFISFRRPGSVKLLAGLMDLGDSAAKNILKKVNSRRYDWAILEGNELTNNSFTYSLGANLWAKAEIVTLNIPADHFPAEPWPWVRQMADLGYSFPANDQCQLRRRSLGIPIKLLGLGLWAVLTTLIRIVVATVAWTSTTRGVDFSPILHPWENDISDITRNTPMDWVFCCRLFGEYEDPKIWRIIMHPWVYMMGFCVMTVVKIVKHLTYWQILKNIGHALLILVHHMWLFALIGLAIGALVGFLVRKLQSASWKAAVAARKSATARLEMESLRDLLVCQSGLKADTAQIPSANRSIHLRYLNIKRKICRPFAS